MFVFVLAHSPPPFTFVLAHPSRRSLEEGEVQEKVWSVCIPVLCFDGMLNLTGWRSMWRREKAKSTTCKASKDVTLIIKNWIIVQCNSRDLIGLTAMVEEPLYHARDIATV